MNSNQLQINLVQKVLWKALLIALALVLAACTTERKETTIYTEDSTAPTISDSTLTASNAGTGSVDLSWTKASDNATAQSSLLYQAYYSLSNNIDSLANIDANGTAFSSVGTDVSSMTVTGLSSNTTYYFSLVVKDAAGNRAAYGVVSYATTSGTVPTKSPANVYFTDCDPNLNQVGGRVTVVPASLEDNITKYNLYWGSSSSGKYSTTAITSLTATGDYLFYDITVDSTLDTGVTHLLAYSANDTGEVSTPTAIAVTDLSLDSRAPGCVFFNDGDATSQEASGTFKIIQSASESSITAYYVYWGTAATTAYGSTVAVISPTGQIVTQGISDNTSIGSSVNYLLVYSYDGSSFYGPVASHFLDVKPPTTSPSAVSFTDTDPTKNEVAGTITVTPNDESHVTQYSLYFGDTSGNKTQSTPIATINATGSSVTYTIGANTSLPSGTTAILAYAKRHSDGSTPVIGSFTEMAAPGNNASGVSFADTDQDAGEIGGTVYIEKASDESDITYYVVYWADDFGKKLYHLSSVGSVAVSGADTSITIASSTKVPSGASRLLVITANGSSGSLVENESGVSTLGLLDLTE